MKNKGWRYESNRHRLASKGIKTGNLRKENLLKYHPAFEDKDTADDLYNSIQLDLIKKGYEDGEWSNQFYVWRFQNTKGDDVEVFYDTTKRTQPYSVIYAGAVDFDGNKNEMLKRYPELKKHLK